MATLFLITYFSFFLVFPIMIIMFLMFEGLNLILNLTEKKNDRASNIR